MRQPAVQPIDVRYVSPYRVALDSLSVDAETPNGQVLGVLRHGSEVTIRIHHGYAERVGDREIGTQLARVARLLVAARMRELRGLQEVHLTPPTEPPRGARAELREQLEAISVSGASQDGAVEAVTLGLSTWTVTVSTGTTARLGSSGLSQAATEAANTAVARWLDEVEQLRIRRHDERRS